MQKYHPTQIGFTSAIRNYANKYPQHFRRKFSSKKRPNTLIETDASAEIRLS